MRARPPAGEPVNPTAATPGWATRSRPAASPCTSPNAPSGQRTGEDPPGPHRQPRMSRVGLDHHRAAGGERARGVPARHREREREVASREDRHRPDRHQHPSQVRPSRRASARIGVVDDDLQERPLGHQVGEHLQLYGRAGELAAQAGPRPGRSRRRPAQRARPAPPRARRRRPAAARPGRPAEGPPAPRRPQRPRSATRATSAGSLCGTGSPTGSPVRGSKP